MLRNQLEEAKEKEMKKRALEEEEMKKRALEEAEEGEMKKRSFLKAVRIIRNLGWKGQLLEMSD
jgi:hypothetical protein